MKVKEIVRQITDSKLYIEIVENEGGASFGFYTKKEIFYRDNLMKATVKSINAQYFNGKRLLLIKVKFN